MAVSIQANVSIVLRKAPTIADLKSAILGARIIRNMINKVSSNSEDTNPFFRLYKLVHIGLNYYF